MRFTKMHGAGNDYIYVDGFHDLLPADPAAAAVVLSDRHKGIGADGLILICPSDAADAEMRMFNADGSRAEMCGNGIRCVAKYLVDHGIVSGSNLTVDTGDGVKTLKVVTQGNGKVDQVRVDMGRPRLEAQQIPTLLVGNASDQVVDTTFPLADQVLQVTCVSMGNPHCVIFVDERETVNWFPSDSWVDELGPQIETDPRFPSRVNVEFVAVRSERELFQRTWERGSGETLACGTGASAVCVAGVLTERCKRDVTIHLKGGSLQLHWDEQTDHVYMTGPAAEVFRGEVDNIATK